MNLSLEDAAEQLRGGNVGVLPTDTVYGLVAVAANQSAVEKIYSIKRRPSQPGTIIAASVIQLQQLGFPAQELSIANNYWPNSVSVVIDASNVADYLKQERPNLPVRIPNSPALLNLLKTTGPLMTTSANAPSEPTSTTLAMAERYFGDAVDFYVDGGDLSDRAPSTIIGIQPSGEVTIFRQGAAAIEPSS